MGETTKLANLIDPEVIGQKIDKKLINLIRFAPLAEVDDTLVGIPGSTHSWQYAFPSCFRIYRRSR